MKILDPGLLEKAVARLVVALQPEAIYLYGSHVYGLPQESSDVDLLVVIRDSPLPPHRRAVPAYRALRGLGLPVEIKIVTRDEFQERSTWRSTIERVVHDRGRMLYEAGVERSSRVVAEGP